MSISGISSNNYNQYQLGASSSPYQQQIQQLSKDLTSGNLSAAQSDFASLQQAFSQSSSTNSAGSTTTSTSNPIAQAFNQLGSDLQSGNLTAAQKDFSTVQQDIQSKGTLSFSHFGHHAHLGRGGGNSSSSLLQDLNQASQSSSSSSTTPAGAQQAYSTLQQEFQQFALSGGSASGLQDQLPLSLVA